MEFQVRFISRLGYAVFQTEAEIGLEIVKMIRKKAGCEIPLNRIDSMVEREAIDVTMGLSEEAAGESENFKDCNRYEVRVPARTLNRFATTAPVINRDNKTGEVIKAGARWEIDREAIYTAWARKGFPAVWDPSEEDDPTDDEDDE